MHTRSPGRNAGPWATPLTRANFIVARAPCSQPRRWHVPCDQAGAPRIREEANARVNAEGFAMLNKLRTVAERPTARRWLTAAAGLAMGLVVMLPAKAQNTIKIGILHS